jgi:hypothetical protein
MKSLGAYCSRDPDPRQIKAQVMSSQQFQDLETRVSKFLSTHRTAVENVTKAASNVFEAVCFVIFARHYENIGYQLVPQNLSEGKFRFRYNTNGLPWRYSYFAVHSYEGQSNKPLFEIWHNQKVAGAWVKDKDEDAEQALFAVDIAVTRAGALPADLPFQESGANHQYWVDQSDLITIGEAKKLVAYPMLLAQFLGIVHEIKPQFIGLGDKHDLLALVSQGHPPPTLLTSDSLTSGARRVRATFEHRNLGILVIDKITDTPERDTLENIKTQVQKMCENLLRTVHGAESTLSAQRDLE